MTIADLVTYLAKAVSPHQRILVQKSVQASLTANSIVSLFTVAPDGGAAPTTAAVPGRTIAGALGQGNPATNLYLSRMDVSSQTGGMFMLYDRLSHQGGLSGTTTGAQTTNLPTAALTRYTSGVGVHAAIEIYSAVGSTGTTLTTSYTNQAGTSGQTSQAIAFGGNGHKEATIFQPISLAQGDSGVRAVASVTIPASTLTAGNFGVTLLKPLALFPVQSVLDSQAWDAVITGCGNLAQVQTDACLCLAFMASNSTGVGPLLGQVLLIED